MIVAVLFNSDHPKYKGCYGYPICKTILRSGVLQSANRHMKISIGDVLLYSHSKTKSQYFELAERTFFGHPFQMLLEDKLRSTYLTSTVFAWVIQNITLEIAEKLHNALRKDNAYLGMHGVNFSYPPHLVFYKNLIGEKYRIIGNSCRIFYSMGEEDTVYDTEKEDIRSLGFSEVEWEDSGARGTIFDNYDTLEHFKQIDDFIVEVSESLTGGENQAFELTMILSDLNPKLFNTLGAAVRALKRIQNEEDIAQVGLSGRRYLEQLADVLFQPRDEMFNGRKVTKEKYKNRLWAFIEESFSEECDKDIRIEEIGKEVDRLIEIFNAVLHSDADIKKIKKAFGDLTILSIELLTLQPVYKNDPYFAYELNIKNFLHEVLEEK
jgi:hypothetical protein